MKVSLILFVHFVVYASLFKPCCAFDKPRMLADLDVVELNKTSTMLQQNLVYFQIDSASSDRDCPVCNNEMNRDGDNEDMNQLFQSTLSMANGYIKRSSSFAGFARGSKSPLGRRRYNKAIRTEAIVSILTGAASHFEALSIRAQRSQRAPRAKSAARDTSSPVLVELFGVLQAVAETSAKVANNIGNAIQKTDSRSASTATASAGLVTSSVLAVLGFLERVNLAATSLVVDTLRAMNGQYIDNEDIDARITEMKESLSNEEATKEGGVFGDVLTFLSQRRDKSGLDSVLLNLTVGLSSLQDRLDSFYPMAISAAASSRSEKSANAVVPAVVGGGTIPKKALMEVAGLVTGLAATNINMLQRFVVNGTDGLLVSALGILLRRFTAVLNQSMTTLNSVLGLFRTEDKDATTTVGDTLLFLLCLESTDDNPEDDEFDQGTGGLACLTFLLLSPLLIVVTVLSPILVPLLLILVILQGIQQGILWLYCNTIGSCSRTRMLVSCQLETLSCQSQALSAALSSV